MKLLNNVILKHLACSYLVHCKMTKNDTLSFERYLEIYNYNIKNCANDISDIVSSAQKKMKELKKADKKSAN